MTTRFFDFRKYTYKGKDSNNNFPTIKRKLTNNIIVPEKPQVETDKPQDYDQSNQFFDSELKSPQTYQINEKGVSKPPKGNSKLATVETNNNQTKTCPKEPDNLIQGYEKLCNVLSSNSPPHNSLRTLTDSGTALERKKSSTYTNKQSSEVLNPKNDSESPVRKRLKRFLNYDTNDEENSPMTEMQSTKKQTIASSKIKNKAISDSSDSNCDIEENSDDEAAYLELQDCLEISEAMKNTIISTIGGNDLAHQNLIRESFHNGRFNPHHSYNLPDTFLRISPRIISKLKDYQKCGIHWLLTLHNAHRNGILADEMGLGKTAQTCVFFNYLYATGEVTSPSIIATPASLLDNWLTEIDLWAPDLHGRVMKYQGKQSERRELILEFIERMNQDNRYFILLTSINTLASNWDLQYLRQIKPLSYLAVDEAHSLKNQNSQVYRKLNKVYCSDRRLLLTGSPVQNRTTELRNLLLFVMPHVFEANSLDVALSYYEKQIKLQNSSIAAEDNARTKEIKSQNSEIKETPLLEEVARYLSNKRSISSAPDVQCLQQVLAPFILRRLKTEVLADLPAKKSSVIRCEIEGRQASLYLEEIKKRNSRLLLSLQKLRNIIYPSKADKKVNDKSESKLSPTTITSEDKPKQDTLEPIEDDKENFDAESNSGSFTKNQNNKQFVNSLMSRLRRICNHPLMMQGYYTDGQIKEVVDHYYLNVEGFMGNPRKKVETEISKWSDFEIHQGIQHLIQINDHRLSHLLIPKEVLLNSAKIKRMIDLVKEINDRKEKALIFSQFTTYLNIIEEVLVLALPEVQYLRLDGSTSVIERQNIVNNFNNNPEITIFMLSTKAGGQGLNLSSARTVILMDQDWNPHNDRQAEDRVHRLGQTKEVLIYRLCCRATIEETILECCQKKLDLDEAFGGDSELLQAAILQESIINSTKIIDTNSNN